MPHHYSIKLATLQDYRAFYDKEVEFRRAMHDYFGAMRIPIRQGRGFTAEDGPTAPQVAVVQ